MANEQGPGFVDQHIEKVLLGICLAVLLFAVASFGLSSPREYDFVSGSGTLSPKQVDAELLQTARSLEDRVNRQQPDPVPESQDLQVLRQLQNQPLASRELISLDFGEPQARGIELAGVTTGPKTIPPLDELASVMPAPAKPRSWAGSEMPFKEVTIEDQRILALQEEVTTWRAVSWYPWNRLREAWMQQLRGTSVLPEVIALGYDVEVQVRQPDGSWATAPGVKPFRLPDPQTGQRPQAPELPDFTGENAQEVTEAVLNYEKLGWSMYMLQPPYYTIWTPAGEQGTWLYHFPELPPEYLSAFEVSEETDRPDQPGPGETVAPPAAPTGTGTGTRRMNTLMPAAPGISTRTPSRRTTPSAVRRPGAMPGPGGEPEDDQDIPQPVTLPETARQFELGRPLLWAHLRGLEPGRDYRCRFRMIFVNPYLANRHVHEARPEDAQVKTIASAWSAWSDPVEIQRDVQFFVTGANPLGNKLTVTIFTTYLGQRVVYKIGDLTPGQLMDAESTVRVINPATGQVKTDAEGNLPTVTFRTGAVALAFNFNKTFTTESGRVKRDGVELIYLASDGEVRSRLMSRDRDSEAYRDLDRQARETRQAVEQVDPTRRPRDAEDRRTPGRRQMPTPTPGREEFPGGPGGPGMPGMEPPGMGNPRQPTRRR